MIFAFIIVVGHILYGAATKTTHVTFSHAVQVPGMILPAGKYTFSLQAGNSTASANRNIVRITTGDGQKVLASILTIPDYRPVGTGHAVITFGEKGDCANITAIKAWFYPHERYGYRFIYAKEEATQIARACHEPVPETSDTSSPTGTSLSLITQSQQEQNYDVKQLASSDKSDNTGFDSDPN
jgi:hypothetical protein